MLREREVWGRGKREKKEEKDEEEEGRERALHLIEDTC